MIIQRKQNYEPVDGKVTSVEAPEMETPAPVEIGRAHV